MLSICSNFAIYASLCLYYVTVFSDICTHMNLPLLNTVTNVYCDGVFDCLHRGHMNQFRQAHNSVAGGVRLFVGVMNDADATAYKRQPVMSEEERYAVVANCQYVHQVIRSSPEYHSVSKEGEPVRPYTVSHIFTPWTIMKIT